MHRRRVVAAFLALTALVASCGGGDDDDASSDTTAASPTSDSSTAPSTSTSTAPPTTATTTPGPTAPLTGLPISPAEAGELADRPALAVKTDNHPNARPQNGLDLADVVYEVPVEGITRYIAVYHSTDPGVVGPIRSTRGIDANTLYPLHPLYAISGGVAQFVSAVRATTQLFQEGTEGYYRSRERSAPHNLYATAADLWPQADDEHSAPPPQIFDFLDADEPFPGEEAVASVDLHVLGTHVTYEWDDAGGTWLRLLEGTPHTTSPDDAQIAPTNVIIQFLDRSGEEMGSGDAWIFVDGQVVRGTWAKEAADGITTFATASGAPVELEPGRTWVNMVPASQDVTVTGPAGGAASSPRP